MRTHIPFGVFSSKGVLIFWMAPCQTDKALTKLAQVLASSCNGKYSHLYLQLNKQGHVFPLTMHALG